MWKLALLYLLSIFSDNDEFQKVEDGFFKCQSLLNESKNLTNIR